MTQNPDIVKVVDLLAHAHAMESEAQDRYLELADQLELHHNAEVAALFRKMAEIEQRHVQQILERAGGIALPRRSPWAYNWRETEAPEVVPAAAAHYLMTPHHALSLVLQAEQRALAFYSWVLENVADAEVLALARVLAEEEREHVALMEAWLAKYPKPPADWAEDPDPPVNQE